MKKSYQKLAQKSLAGALVATIALTGASPLISAKTAPNVVATQATQNMTAKEFVALIKTTAFTDATYKALKPTITKASLDRLKGILDTYGYIDTPDEEEAAELYSKAKSLFPQFAYEKATNQLQNLETAVEKPNFDVKVLDQVDQVKLALYDVEDKANYAIVIGKYNAIYDTLNQKIEAYITTTIDGFYTDNTRTKIDPNADLSGVYMLPDIFDYVSDSAISDKLNQAYNQLIQDISNPEKEEEAQMTEKVANLFTGESKTVLQPSVTLEMIKALEAEVNAMENETMKATLMRDIKLAYSLLPAETVGPQHPGYVAQVEKAINALFTTSEQTALKPGIRDREIGNVEIEVGFITQADVKARLLKVIDKAYTLYFTSFSPEYAPLDALVSGLFTDSSETFLKNGVKYEQISDVKARVRVADIHAVSRQKLNKRLDHAQSLLTEGGIQKPTIQPYTEQDAYITGKTSANTAYVGLFIDGKRVKLASVVSGGDYQISALGFNLNAGTNFEIRGYTKNNTPSDPAKAVVQAPAEDAYKLTANQLAANDTFVTGEVGSGVDSVRLVVDGVVVKTGQITDSTYKITTAGYVKETSTVQVIGLKGRVEMARTNVSKAFLRANVSAITTKDDMVTGSIQAGTGTKIRLSINNVAIRTAPIQADGTFQSYIGKQTAGTEVKVEVFEGSAYNQARTTIVKVIK